MTVQDEFFNDNYQALSDASVRISKGSPLAEDLLSYTIETFLTRKDTNEIISSGGARFFMVRIMMNSWNSSTSPFYNIYRKQTTETLEETHEEIPEEEDFTDYETADKIATLISSMPWYEGELWKMIHEEGYTAASLARETGIPRTSISFTINRIKKWTRLQLEKDKK